MNPEDVWADFDALIDLDEICTTSIENRIALVNRISAACCMQVVSQLYELRQTRDGELREKIESDYLMWKDIHSKLLNF